MESLMKGDYGLWCRPHVVGFVGTFVHVPQRVGAEAVPAGGAVDPPLRSKLSSRRMQTRARNLVTSFRYSTVVLFSLMMAMDSLS